MSPEDVFASHVPEAVDVPWCGACGQHVPCDAYSVATWAAEQRALSAEIIADLISQRDGAV